MVSLPSSEPAGPPAPALDAGFRFFSLTGVEAPGPREWEPMLVAVPLSPQRWESAALRVNGAMVALQLRRLGGATVVVAEWPRSGPGHYQLELRAHSGVRVTNLRVHPAKLSEGELGQLLTELETELPYAIAIALQGAGGLTGLTLTEHRPTTLAEELARLRRVVDGIGGRPGLADLLRDISRDPYVRLRSHEHWVPRERSRRPAVSALVQALTRAGNLTAERSLLRVADMRVEHTVDTYENRIVATLVRQVRLRLRRLGVIARATGKSLLAAEADQFGDRMARSERQAPFLRDVGELRSAPDRATMVLLRRPEYRAALDLYLAFQRGLSVNLESPLFDSPLEQLPALYQLWATLHVIRAFVEAAGEAGYRVVEERLIGFDAGGVFLRPLPDGRPAVMLRHPAGASAALIPERRYLPRTDGARRVHSISYEQRPDVAIEVLSPGGHLEIIVLDPKYKLDGELGEPDSIASGRPTKFDIDRMHAYRDAIRDRSGLRVVQFAGILYPGPSVALDPGLAALRARPDESQSLRASIAQAVARVLLNATSTVVP